MSDETSAVASRKAWGEFELVGNWLDLWKSVEGALVAVVVAVERAHSLHVSLKHPQRRVFDLWRLGVLQHTRCALMRFVLKGVICEPGVHVDYVKE